MNSEKQAIIFIDGNNLYHNLRQMKIKPGNLDFEKLAQLIQEGALDLNQLDALCF